MDNLAGAKYFSAMDLTAGYYQIALHPSDCAKTAFNTHIGKYEWKVLPMGLSNSPSAFQSIMNTLFAPRLNKCVCVYLDDLLVFSHTPEEHIGHLHMVFDILRREQLKLKLRKCEFFKQELKFLGHLVSAKGMRPDPAKVKVVTDWPQPRSVFDVRSFLGLAGYFRKYIQGYSSTAAPLTDLLSGIAGRTSEGKLYKYKRLTPAQTSAIETEFQQVWTPECANAFEDLKRALTTAPVLALPDFEKPFELVADACQVPCAIGAVLLQSGRPVAFYSRKCAGPELRYGVSDLEMLAVIAALREWRCYMQGRPFKIVTDHKPNTYLDNNSSVNSHTLQRRARWLEISSAYDYIWEYRPGRLNVADPISRAPQHFLNIAQHQLATACLGFACTPSVRGNSCERCQSQLAEVSPDQRPHACAFVSSKPFDPAGEPSLCAYAPCLGALTRSQARCTSDAARPVTPARAPSEPLEEQSAAWEPDQLLRSPSAESDDDLPAVGTEPDLEQVGQYVLHNFSTRVHAQCLRDPQRSTLASSGTIAPRTQGALTLYWTDQNRLYVPTGDGLRRECFEAAHSHPYSGHYGIMRTLRRLQETYYWPNMKSYVEQNIRRCDSCQRVKADRRRPAGLLKPLDIPGRRWESISMDFIMGLPKTLTKGYTAILVVVDRLSKMAHLIPTTDSVTAEQTAELYEEHILRLHGVPQSIVSDRDPRFVAAFWKKLNELMETDLRMSTADHPQTDGQTERANGVLEDTLRHAVGPMQHDWHRRLPAAEFAMNSAWHHSIRNTPFMLNYGQQPDSPPAAVLRSHIPGINQFVGRWTEQLAAARKCLQAARDRYKAQADKKRTPQLDYQVGDLVLLKVTHFRMRSKMSRKLAPRYVGPFEILKAVGVRAFKLKLPEHVRMHNVFHVSAIKPYHTDGPYQPPPLPELIDGDPEWEVDFIENTRLVGGRPESRQYLVHWLGFGPEHATWEPLRNLKNAPERIQEFWKRKELDCPHPL